MTLFPILILILAVIQELRMDELLASEVTKKPLTEFLSTSKALLQVRQQYNPSDTMLLIHETTVGEKLSPTKGSFKKDLLWALHQLYDAQKYGWHLGDDGTYSAETTDADSAPKAIIELISCNCRGNCNDRLWMCKECCCLY